MQRVRKTKPDVDGGMNEEVERENRGEERRDGRDQTGQDRRARLEDEKCLVMGLSDGNVCIINHWALVARS